MHAMPQASWAQGLTEQKGGGTTGGGLGGGAAAAPAAAAGSGRVGAPADNSGMPAAGGKYVDAAAGSGQNGSGGGGGRGRASNGSTRPAWGRQVSGAMSNGATGAPDTDASPFAAVPPSSVLQPGLPAISTQARASGQPAAAAKAAGPGGRPPTAHITALKTQPVAVHSQVLVVPGPDGSLVLLSVFLHASLHPDCCQHQAQTGLSDMLSPADAPRLCACAADALQPCCSLPHMLLYVLAAGRAGRRCCT